MSADVADDLPPDEVGRLIAEEHAIEQRQVGDARRLQEIRRRLRQLGHDPTGWGVVGLA